MLTHARPGGRAAPAWAHGRARPATVTKPRPATVTVALLNALLNMRVGSCSRIGVGSETNHSGEPGGPGQHWSSTGPSYRLWHIQVASQ